MPGFPIAIFFWLAEREGQRCIFSPSMIETHPRSRAMLGHKVTTVNDYLCTTVSHNFSVKWLGNLMCVSFRLLRPLIWNMMEYDGIWWNMDIPKAPSIFSPAPAQRRKIGSWKKPGSNFHGFRSPMSCSMLQPPRKDDNSSSVEVRSRANP